ncbi:MAG: response regulator transcription factor [Ginsengibacter sp.]
MKLLIIEDEISLLNSIREYFTRINFLCEGVTTFADALDRIDEYSYDCVILDINLPDGNGFEVLRYLREDKKEEGVVIISARNSLDDKIKGLNLGADDYLTKPFHLSELNARVNAIIRRKYAKGIDVLEAGCLEMNLAARTVMWEKRPISLTKNEFNLLLFLVSNKNHVVSKQAIAEHIYGDQTEDMPSFFFVYSQIKNLKKKLKERGCENILQTVYGLGYKLKI